MRYISISSVGNRSLWTNIILYGDQIARLLFFMAPTLHFQRGGVRLSVQDLFTSRRRWSDKIKNAAKYFASLARANWSQKSKNKTNERHSYVLTIFFTLKTTTHAFVSSIN